MFIDNTPDESSSIAVLINPLAPKYIRDLASTIMNTGYLTVDE